MSFLVANNGATIPAKFDGALRSTYAQNKDYIVQDVADEFEMTYNSSSLQVSVGGGVANISGRGISSEEENSITLPTNSTIYLCLRIDLSQIEGQEGMLYANTSSIIANDVLSNGSGIHDMLLAIVQTNANGVVSLVDKRNIQHSAGGTITEETPFNINGLEFKLVKVTN